MNPAAPDPQLSRFDRAIDRIFPDEAEAALVAKRFFAWLDEVLYLREAGNEWTAHVRPGTDQFPMYEPFSRLTAQQRARLHLAAEEDVRIEVNWPSILEQANLIEEKRLSLEIMGELLGTAHDLDLLRAFDRLGDLYSSPAFETSVQEAAAAVRYCVEHAPRRADGALVELSEMNERCRSDTTALLFVDEMTALLEPPARHLMESLGTVAYCPRGPGASRGDGEALSAVDKEDIAKFLMALSLAVRMAFDKLRPDTKRSAGVVGVARNIAEMIVFSAAELLLFRFLKERFPALFQRCHDDEEQSPARSERSDRLLLAWADLARTVADLADSVKRKAEPAWEDPRPDAARLKALLRDRIAVSIDRIRKLQNLQILCTILFLPKRTARRDVLADSPLQASPNRTTVMHIEFKSKQPANEWTTQTCVTRWRPALTHKISTTIQWKCKHKGLPVVTRIAGITLHRPGGEPCPAPDTVNTFGMLFHPEHPTAILVKGLASMTDEALVKSRNLLKSLGIAQILTMGDATKDIMVVFHISRRRRLRKFGRKSNWTSEYVVLPRAAARALRIYGRTRELWDKELRFLEEQELTIPEDPVYLLAYRGWNDDDDAGNAGPPSPSPQPSPREAVEV